MKNNPDKFFEELEKELLYLKLTFMNNHYKQLADDAAAKQHSHMEYFHNLVLGEAEERKNRARKRRIQLARFPVIKTLEQFRWNWPKKINQLHVQNLFRLSFIEDKGNVIFREKLTWQQPWVIQPACEDTRCYLQLLLM
jgi:DNA replication protein DnaC